jgi:ATP-binding cassette subfamily G (WHITE) protein 8 (sterolin 2)
VIETIKKLSKKQRTVIMSIHQPRYDVFSLVDDVVLLSRGSVVFSGSSVEMLKHFEKLNFPCPSLTNPADFILDISSIDVLFLLLLLLLFLIFNIL